MPAAVQRSTICPSRQRVTLRLVVRAMEIIDSIGFEVVSVVASRPVIPSRATVNSSVMPSRSDAAAPGCLRSSAVARALTSRSPAAASGLCSARTSFAALKARSDSGRCVAAIQRCTVHQRRNVAEQLRESERAFIDAKLVRALHNPDAAAGLRDVKALATALERKHPGAAASLREGITELFTVARLGITGRLATTLTTSNPIESMISIARATNRNVTRWRDGQMVLRWTAAGMLNAQRSFRRVKGYKQMPQLVAALRRHAHPTTARSTEPVGAAA